MTSLPPPLTINTLSKPSVNTSRNSMSIVEQGSRCKVVASTAAYSSVQRQCWQEALEG